MYNVACPHCNTMMVDDGSLAGQVVQCPTCGGHLTMPPFPAPPPINVGTPPAPPAGNPVVRHEHDYQFSVGRHRATSTAKHTFGGGFGLSAGFSLGCLAVLGLCMVLMVGCFIVLAGIGSAVGNKEPRSSPSQYRVR